MAKCAPCMSEEVKDVLIEEFPALRKQLKKLPPCEEGKLANFCARRTKDPDAPKSEYQEFVSACMKEKHVKGIEQAAAAMKKCAIEWHEHKATAVAEKE